MATPLPWSYSAISSVDSCPHKHLEVKVLKHFKDESGEAAQWGTYVHKCIEDAVTIGIALPENTLTYAPQVWAAIGGDLKFAVAEKKLSINNKFEPVEWADRWGGSISDILKVMGPEALVVDWKLGKVKPSDQLKVNAVMVFHNYLEVDVVHTSFEWLAHGGGRCTCCKGLPVSTKSVYWRHQLPELWASIMPKLRQYAQCFKNDVWQMRPSGLCRNYCVVSTCQHCGQYAGKNIKVI